MRQRHWGRGHRVVLFVGAIAGLSACSEAEGGRGSGGWTSAASSQSAGDGIGDGIVDPTESGDGGDGFDDDGDGGDGGNVKFDFPDNGGAGDESSEEDGCQKVDFVFVIDSSPSMEDEQSNLLASFPGFVAAIEDQLQINDFHVMVVDAGELGGGACDGTLGAGQIRSGGGQDCGLVGGQRYATQAQPDLPAAFACMANRGDSGPTNERTMDSLLQAVGLQNLVGNCNDGFLRDDAILVVTVITDEEDSGADGMPGIPPLDGSCVAVDEDPNSAGDPAAWKSTLLTAKDGNEDAIVVLGLLGDCDVGGCPGMALDPFGGAALTGAEPAPRLRAFVESFAFGTVGPVCAPDYAPFFASSVNVIESACSDFVPPA